MAHDQRAKGGNKLERLPHYDRHVLFNWIQPIVQMWVENE